MTASFHLLRYILLFVFSFFNFLQLSAQTDSSTINSRETAVDNSNSGHYRSARYKPHHIADLSEFVKETSGLILLNGQLWTINDSGNPPELFLLDSTNGNILRTVVIRNSINTDWEGITQDDSNVYIGDFGNNAGSRTDLYILKIAKSALLSTAIDTVKAGYIHFSFPDQTDFATAFNKNNFDCEALFFYNDSLHLFSKNWSDKQTNHYVLPADTGNYKARLVERFNADGLITDAAINAKGNIVLLGYKKSGRRAYKSFAWLLSGYEGSVFFGGNKRRLKLGSAMYLGQTEGILLKNDNTGWFSSESIQSGWFSKPSKLFSFDFDSFYGAGSME